MTVISTTVPVYEEEVGADLRYDSRWVFTTGHFGRANSLPFLAQDAVCAVGLGNKATATSCGIRNQCVWQKVSGSEYGWRRK